MVIWLANMVSMGKGNATRPQNLYQESINIPLVIFGPKNVVKSPQIREEFVNLYDLFPTFVELSEIELATEYIGPGKSLVPLLKGETAKNFRRYHYAEYGNARMIHDGKLKLVRYYKKEPKNSFENIWYQLGEKGSERSAIAQPKNKTSAQMVEALEVFFSKYEVQEHSGRRIWDQPRHNISEAWR